MAILGLLSTESVANQRWTNIRRKVFYQYPNGSAPLIGLLSMMKEDEVNDPVFSWWEKRLKEQVTLTRALNDGANGPFGKGANGQTVLVDATDSLVFSSTSPTTYSVAVDSSDLFRKGHVFRIKDVSLASGTATLTGLVTAITTDSAGKALLQFVVVDATVTLPSNLDTENIDYEVQVIGSAFSQGVVDLSNEAYYLPVNIENHSQIFRTPFSFTGNALVTPIKFDDTGVYKDKAKQHSMDHMIEQELAFIFGKKSKHVPTGTADPTTGVGLPRYYTGGILYWLTQWEATSNNIYESTGASADTDDNKRIIANTSGLLSSDTYDTYLERIFRTTSNVSNEKLVLCGTGFLKVVQQMYKGQSCLNYDMPRGDTFGMEIVAHKTAFGTIFYKTHPLFSRNSTLRNNALFIDIHNMRYRPMSKRDTQLLKNRQPRDADYRKDEWFTEAGLELRFPESFMYLQNVQQYVP